MKWYKHLYVGESLQGKEKQVKSLIRHDMVVPFAYVVTLPANPKNLMDVVAASELRKKQYPKEDLCVIGIASDKGEAIGLVQQIIEDAYQEMGSLNIREYLKIRHAQARQSANSPNQDGRAVT